MESVKRLGLLRSAAPSAVAGAEPATALPRPEPSSATRALEIAVERARRGVRGVMATVLARHGSAPGTPGQKLYLGEDGTCAGTVGGGAVERAVLEALVTMMTERGKHETRTFALGPELGMCCGGRLDVLLEPLEAVVPCLVVGAGHVATALAPLLPPLGFAVTVVDAREGWTLGKEGEGVRAIACEHDDLDDEEIDPRGACLVMTHDHQLDQRAIEWALKKGFAYVGGVGSRAKAERTKKRLEAKGFSEADRARVRMPVGLDIGARLPEEIAIAIAAELVAWRRRR
jgi:xanthine dehydrogenase accessory factor